MSASIRRATSWVQPTSVINNNNNQHALHASSSVANLIEDEEASPFIGSMSTISNGLPVGAAVNGGAHYSKNGSRAVSWRRLRQRYLNSRAILAIFCLASVFCFIVYISSFSSLSSNATDAESHGIVKLPKGARPAFPPLPAAPPCEHNTVLPYNTTYPLTTPERINDGWRYRIGMIADQDTKSWQAEGKYYSSVMRFGYLWISDNFTIVKFEWPESDNLVTYKSGFGDYGRGMELSELVVYNGHLYAVDDRTGLVYNVSDYKNAIPWVILMDGDGNTVKGFKSEWATVKDNYLYIGGWGKEWTTVTGELVNTNPMWIKKINVDGSVHHINWLDNYRKLRSAMGVEYPGFVIHEAAIWSSVRREWFFLPRKLSKTIYNEEAEANSGSNVLVRASEHFDDIKVMHVGQVQPTHGFSTFKFVPQTHDTVLVALKTEESHDALATYIVVFKLLPEDNNSSTADVVMAETKIDETYKFEGIEFL